ncbi:PREDICTED: ADAMTS-like protein 3 [Priapulus caudatus]|uniref:ADAMTS-like protein 3 n=1 Tax=Priapulus caudatus TaxID=37621 RepID=A0ABM1DP57_PRICU|nr:PREDICTED: ADAMTS-like protein 3 [Priapulus caudatus]
MWRRMRLAASRLFLLALLILWEAGTCDAGTKADVQNDGGFAHWSAWGAWSECTRTCGGGVQKQQRTCQGQGSICRGEGLQYRMCNTKPCGSAVDWRVEQCWEYNSKPYRSRSYTWLPFHNHHDPCALTCQAKKAGFVVVLSPMVKDGTPCAIDSKDVCVTGICKPVGCDKVLGSSKKVDQCGVCGGDGSKCGQPMFQWRQTDFSACSVTCGGGTDGWIADDWGVCSTTCDGGTQYRDVYCAQELRNSSRVTVQGSQCMHSKKPVSFQTCSIRPCASWAVGEWTACSVTCGKGQKSRSVRCREVNGQYSNMCDNKKRPAGKQRCDTGAPCIDADDLHLHQVEATNPVPLHQSKEEIEYTMPTHPEPKWMVSDWGPCTTTCGPGGVRIRSVKCKVFMVHLQTYVEVPEPECVAALKPPEVETCNPGNCYKVLQEADEEKGDQVLTANSMSSHTYSWIHHHFTQCSKSCLGGERRSVVQCTRETDQQVVSDKWCDPQKKPTPLVEKCNTHSCPPRWEASEWTECSHSCGGGMQSRSVRCIHEQGQGDGNKFVLPHELCPKPMPQEQQLCNAEDCPPYWATGSWTPCSKSCDYGVQERAVHCRQVKRLGQVVFLPPDSCPTEKPTSLQACFLDSCPGKTTSYFTTTPATYIQSGHMKKLILKAKGHAIILEGTNVKIKCPGKKGHDDVSWAKNGIVIRTLSHVRISKNGALRIKSATKHDAGEYTCIAGSKRRHITLNFRTVDVDGEGKIKNVTYNSKTLNANRTMINENIIPTIHNERIDVTEPNEILEDKDSYSRYINRSDVYHIPLSLSHRKENKTEAPYWNLDMPTTTMYTQEAKEKDEKLILDLKLLDQEEKDDTDNEMKAKDNTQIDNELNSDGRGSTHNEPGREDNSIEANANVNPPHMQHVGDLLRKLQLEIPDINNLIDFSNGQVDDLAFDWKTMNWTDCSQTCGGHGVQARTAVCEVSIHGKRKKVDSTLCTEAGLPKPPVMRKCGIGQCPGWIVGNWSNVSADCTKTCGVPGLQSRILQCVWYGTKKPAGEECSNKPRPSVVKICQTPSCLPEMANCYDHSRYCSLAKRLNMCRLSTYQIRCCKTCTS